MKLLIVVLAVVWTTVVQADPVYQVQNSGINSNLVTVFFQNEANGYVGGYGLILKTTNGGTNWVTRYVDAEIIRSIYFVDDNTGYACGDGGRVLKTVNAGLNWTVDQLFNMHLWSVYFLAGQSQIGYCMGTYATLIKTTNAGLNWVLLTTGLNTNDHYSCMHMQGNNGFIGVEGTTNLIKTTDAGVSWINNRLKDGEVYTQSLSFNGLLGYVVGVEVTPVVKPVIFKTVNYGQNWSEYPVASLGSLRSVRCLNNNSNIACAVGHYSNDPISGNKGLIMMTTNSGNSWSETAWNADVVFYGVCSSGNSMFIVGQFGTIIKAVNLVDIRSLGTEIPSGYNLKQNFPNPFNPTTKINFSIPKSGMVNLKVFDMNGKEVETIINEAKAAGTYQADFDASALSSGIYFYTLEAEGFKETKKMMLIK